MPICVMPEENIKKPHVACMQWVHHAQHGVKHQFYSLRAEKSRFSPALHQLVGRATDRWRLTCTETPNVKSQMANVVTAQVPNSEDSSPEVNIRAESTLTLAQPVLSKQAQITGFFERTTKSADDDCTPTSFSSRHSKSSSLSVNNIERRVVHTAHVGIANPKSL
jgi:hypothetical protein